MTRGSRRSGAALTLVTILVILTVAAGPAAAAGSGTTAGAGIDFSAVIATLVGMTCLAGRR